MAKDLYYKIEENGYWILDKNDPMLKIHQYEPYIPDHTKSYEENAKAQIAELTAVVDITETEEYQRGYDDAVLAMIEAGLL